MVNLKTHWSTCRSDSCCAALPGYMVWRSQGAKRSHKSIIKIKKLCMVFAVPEKTTLRTKPRGS